MRVNKPRLYTTLVIAIMLGILACGISACDSDSNSRNTRAIGGDFQLKDIDGNDVRLSDFKGKAVLLEFWATWCPTCVDSVPELSALHRKYNKKGLEVIGISMDQSVSDVMKFARDKKIPYTILLSNPSVEKQYGVVNIPILFMVNKSGVVEKRILGYAKGIADDLEKDIRLLIEEIPLT